MTTNLSRTRTCPAHEMSVWQSSTHLIQIRIDDFQDENGMRQGKGLFYFDGEGVHDVGIFAKNLRAHAVGLHDEAFVSVDSLDEIMDFGHEFHLQGVVTDVYGYLHWKLFLFLQR